jgi:aspartyl-tRNA(Asn)/glutamyl-tRNA(Gln) amidotransferase subunit A
MFSTRDRLDAILASPAARHEHCVFLKLYPDAARAAADAADCRRKAGVTLGPLDGKIVSIKDLFDVAGEPTTAGSLLRRSAAPAQADAVVVRRLRQAGAVIVGKTNMPEFAFDALGLNPHHGTPGNAVDATRIPGGSSSGAGVSVAEGTSDIAIGSDTGGSTRIPASFNGVVGFKPTVGRVPLDGAFELSFTLDSIGPLARTVADCAAADAVMAGTEAHAQVFSVAGLRVAIPRGLLLEHLEPGVAEAYERSLRQLEASGAQLIDHAIDDLIAAMGKATEHGSIASIEGAALHVDWLETETASLVDPRTRGVLLRRLNVPAHAYIRMMRLRAELVAAMNERLSTFDVLALPTTPITAPVAAPLISDGDLADQIRLQAMRYTYIANLFALTAISLPMPGLTLPAGLMLMARGGDDRRLLAIAAGVEEILGRPRL